MTLFDILLFVLLMAAGFQFWRIRAISERANQYIADYCEQQNLQLVSVARQRTRPMLLRGKLEWRSEFQFEFSSTGSDSYTGTFSMKGMTPYETYVPTHRI